MKAASGAAADRHWEYIPRLVDGQLQELLLHFPALFLVGPRAAGKTTTAARFAASTVKLDGPDGQVFLADPDAALRGLEEPVLIDEWQAVPDVLGAVKRAVDAEWRPGRFIITGSVRAHRQPSTWPGTGRLIRVTMYGLTERELEHRLSPASLVARVLDDGPNAVPERVQNAPDLVGYIERLVRGGFPQPIVQLDPAERLRWHDSYIEQLVSRDVQAIDVPRDPDRLRRFLAAYAACTAQVTDDATLIRAAAVNRRTVHAYEALMRDLFAVEPLPAWWSNRLKRLVRLPRRHVVEPALGLAALEMDDRSLFRDGRLLGPYIETFVVAQLRAEITARGERIRLHHLRQEGGRHEVDIVAEAGPSRIVGIEVKAGVATPDDARHLNWLREELGPRFRGGLVLHTGAHTYQLADRVVAAPIAAVWS